MKSLTVCENSLVEQKDQLDILKETKSKKVYDVDDTKDSVADGEAGVKTPRFSSKENDEDSGADVQDEGSEDGKEEDRREEPVRVAPNIHREESPNSSREDESGISDSPDVVVVKEVVSLVERDVTREAVSTAGKLKEEVKVEVKEEEKDAIAVGDVSGSFSKERSTSGKDVAVKVSPDEGAHDVAADREKREEWSEVPNKDQLSTSRTRESAVESTEKEKPKEKTMEGVRTRLSRPMPKSKKLSLLQEEELQKRLQGQAEKNDEEEMQRDRSDREESEEGGKCNEANEGESSDLKESLKRKADLDEGKRETKRTLRMSSTAGRKRQIQVDTVSESTRVKKKRIAELREEIKNGHNSSPSSSDNENMSTSESRGSEKDAQQVLPRKSSRGESSTNSPSSSLPEVVEKPKGTTYSILSNLRGTLKSLTRSDLEELIIQKLCEVITERSTVGELRRKAQALEEDQERWRSKVQALNKQVREMEMVMKKYMSEVQKQTKEGSNQVVPLKVTRSVGLQVSFFSGGNKTQKSSPQANTDSNTVQKGANPNNAKSNARPLAQLQLQPPFNLTHPSVQTRNKVTSNQKGGAGGAPAVATPSQRLPQTQNGKKPGHQKHDQGSIPLPAGGNKARRTTKSLDGNKVVLPTSTAQQQQNSSKVIDLTDDDDRQSTVVAPRTQAPMKIVNQSPQALTQNGRFTYILPATTTTTATAANAQNLQVLIASPTIQTPASRHQIVSMPPLLFKGANPTQPVSQVLNPGTRLICPKPVKHPAPLPPQPICAYHKPNVKLLPPRPGLKISRVDAGIVLSWNMTLGPEHAPISSYQLFAYQEGNSPPATSLWKKVGDVKALPLPMACTLTHFLSGHKYHFAVRAVDHLSRIGPFSFPGTIVLEK